MECCICLPVIPDAVGALLASLVDFSELRQVFFGDVSDRLTKVSAFKNETEIQDILCLLAGYADDLIAEAREAAENSLVAERYQRFTDRRLAAAEFLHEFLLVDDLVRFIFIGKNAVQNGLVYHVFETFLLFLHPEKLLTFHILGAAEMCFRRCFLS